MKKVLLLLIPLLIFISCEDEKEEEVVKKEIIKAIQAIGNITQLKKLKVYINNQDKNIQLTYLQAEKSLLVN